MIHFILPYPYLGNKSKLTNNATLLTIMTYTAYIKVLF
jgi:hypothetical protein